MLRGLQAINVWEPEACIVTCHDDNNDDLENDVVSSRHGIP
jgi:hypothetical protein